MLSGKKKDFLFSCLCKQGLISLMSYRSLLKEYSLVPIPLVTSLTWEKVNKVLVSRGEGEDKIISLHCSDPKGN